MDHNDPNVSMNPWHPMQDAFALKHLGKLGEEAGELVSAVCRCIIQGIDECDPETGKPNRRWLEDEIADVIANNSLVMMSFSLDMAYITERAKKKHELLQKWHAMA